MEHNCCHACHNAHHQPIRSTKLKVVSDHTKVTVENINRCPGPSEGQEKCYLC